MTDILIGALIGLAGILAKAVFDALLGGPSGYIALTAAAALAAWVAGFRAGATATLVAGVLNAVIFLAAAWTLQISGIDLGRTILFLVGGIVVSWLIASIRAQRDRLARSVTEIASMADTLERRDERLELVLAASGTGFWEWDIRTGALTWSTAIFTQHGLDPSCGPPDVRELPRDDPPRRPRGVPAPRPGGRRLERFVQVRVPGPVAGRIGPLDRGAGRVFRDADGQPVRMLGTGTDITERAASRRSATACSRTNAARAASARRSSTSSRTSCGPRSPRSSGLTRIIQRPGPRGRSAWRRPALIDDIAVESERLRPARRGPRRADPRRTRRVRGRGRAARAAPPARSPGRDRSGGDCPA